MSSNKVVYIGVDYTAYNKIFLAVTGYKVDGYYNVCLPVSMRNKFKIYMVEQFTKDNKEEINNINLSFEFTDKNPHYNLTEQIKARNIILNNAREKFKSYIEEKSIEFMMINAEKFI